MPHPPKLPNICYGPSADILFAALNVRFRGQSGHSGKSGHQEMSANDPRNAFRERIAAGSDLPAPYPPALPAALIVEAVISRGACDCGPATGLFLSNNWHRTLNVCPMRIPVSFCCSEELAIKMMV
jgi:hypothetical protein